MVKFTPSLEAVLLRYLCVVGFMELGSEPSEHLPDGEVVLVMAVEAGGIEDHRSVVDLSYVTAPEVPVEKGRIDFNVVEEGRYSIPQCRPEIVKLRVTLSVDLLLQLQLNAK